jgi:DNA primase
MLDRLSAAGDLDSPEGRARLLAEARPMLAAFRADGMRMQMTREVADLAGIGLVQLQQYLDKHQEPARRVPDAGASGGDNTGGARRNEWRSDGRPGGRPDGQRQRRQERRPVGVRAGLPSLERRLRLMMVCHPVLAHDLDLDGDAGRVLPAHLRPWVQALKPLAGDAPLAAIVSALRDADLEDIVMVQRDLASDWGSVTQLSADEARLEFDGAIDQLRRRRNNNDARQAAADLQQAGLQDESRRRALLELLENQKRS